MSLAIDSMRDAVDSLNWFTKSLSGGYKITNGSPVRKLFFKNDQRQLAVDERIEMANGDGEWFYEKQCHV